MRRRRILAVVAAGLTGGCSDVMGGGNDISDRDGDGVIDSEDYAPADPSVQEESDAGKNDAGTKQTTGGSAVNQQLKQSILNKYGVGIAKTNEGTRLLNNSISAFTSENYPAASAYASDARTQFLTAEERFSTAYNKALQTSNEEAQRICEEGRQYAVYLQDAATEANRAAEDAKAGRREAANDHIDAHQNALDEAEQLGVRDPSVLKDVLGL